jgi:hypothetical protein
MAAPMASPEPYHSPEFDGTVARLSDDLGMDPAEVERQLARALERYHDARVTQFVMLLAERDVRRSLQGTSQRYAQRSALEVPCDARRE